MMQLEAQEFIPIAEKAGQICFLDIESTGTRADYNSILVISIKPWHKEPTTFKVETPGDDRRLVRDARDLLHQFTMWTTYYGKGFDVPMIQSRLLRHRLKPLHKRLHLDLYWFLKSATLTARHSQAHLIEWLDSPNKKMTLSPEVWNVVLKEPKRGLAILAERCEKDVAGLEGLYDRTKHLIINITR